MRMPFLKLWTAFFTVVIITSGITTIYSCKKSNANAAFTGTYPGLLTLVAKGDTTADTVIISAGSSDNSIIIFEKVEGAVGNATVASNNITIPSQTVPVKGGIYPLNGSGALVGKTLTLTFSEEIRGVFVNSVFTGTKQ